MAPTPLRDRRPRTSGHRDISTRRSPRDGSQPDLHVAHRGDRTRLDPEVATYIAGIPPEHRQLFDRVHRLILDACPTVEVGLSYKMPTYWLGDRRLHVGTWRHGISIYGWKARGDGGFTARHPELQTSTGTIQLHGDRDLNVADDEIRQLAQAALKSGSGAA